MTELWAVLPYGDRRYEVSTLGRVKNIISGRFLKPFVNKYGGLTYYRYNIYLGKYNATKILAHRIVAEAHIAKRKLDRWEIVMHLDNNPTNCNIDNLLIGTQKDNMQHASKCNRMYRANGELSYRHILKEKDVIYIRSLDKSIRNKQLAEIFGCSVSTIQAVRCGRNWSYNFSK